MSTPVRLLAFAAALAAVFVLALVGARILLPADLAQAGQDRTGHPSDQEESEMEHSSSATPSAQHSEDSHDEHGQPRPLTRSAAWRSPRMATGSAR